MGVVGGAKDGCIHLAEKPFSQLAHFKQDFKMHKMHTLEQIRFK